MWFLYSMLMLQFVNVVVAFSTDTVSTLVDVIAVGGLFVVASMVFLVKKYV